MLLDVREVSKIFGPGCNACLSLTGAENERSICPECSSVVAVNKVSLQVGSDEVLGIVGESGSGKSTLLQLLYRDIVASAGVVYFTTDTGEEDRSTDNIFQYSLLKTTRLRNEQMSMIYQDPRRGLNYLFSAGGNIAEKIICSGERRFEVIRDRALHYFEKIELPPSRIDDYANSFSGGQQQRIQIAKALSSSPKLLLLDEPTTGLDVSVQAKILDLIRMLQQEMGFSMIVVSHDLGVISHLTDTTVVMRHGSIIEHGLTDQILYDPQHAYTQLLVSSVL